MNSEKVVFAFFILLAAALNFSFFIGAAHATAHFNVFELFAALVTSLIATVLKFGDRTHIGAVLLATSLVADLLLIATALVWGYGVAVGSAGTTGNLGTSILSLSGGALLANITSVILLVVETVMVRR